MTLFKSLSAVILLGLFLAGCASPAEIKNMVVSQAAAASSTIDTPFRSALYIKRVSGGEETNPLWTSEVSNAAFQGALRGSLAQSHLLSPTSTSAKYDLYATLSKLDQPIFGLDFTVSSRVDYRVVERASMDTWFDEPVIVSFTATFSDSAFAIQRLRLANEGSIRNNIRQFIERLLEIKKPVR